MSEKFEGGRMNKEYMLEAIKEAEIGIAGGHGGPFGAVIVKRERERESLGVGIIG